MSDKLFRAIDGLAVYLEQVMREMHEKTGWAFTLLCSDANTGQEEVPKPTPSVARVGQGGLLNTPSTWKTQFANNGSPTPVISEALPKPQYVRPKPRPAYLSGGNTRP
jgi:hypothetical protein